MNMWYLPGATDPRSGSPREIFSDGDAINGPDGTRYPANWDISSIPGVSPYLAPPRPIEEVRAEKLAALALLRYAHEVGGMVVTGMQIPTDRDTQAKLIATRIIAKEDPQYSVTWKMPGGFVPLDAATIVAVADSVRAHVQACFDNEASHDASIRALTTVEDVAAYDITTGWPTYASGSG